MCQLKTPGKREKTCTVIYAMHIWNYTCAHHLRANYQLK